MAGLSALQSKLSKLNKTSHPLIKKKVSVVFYDPETEEIFYPENVADKILLIPRQMSEDGWQEEPSELIAQAIVQKYFIDQNQV